MKDESEFKIYIKKTRPFTISNLKRELDESLIQITTRCSFDNINIWTKNKL